MNAFGSAARSSRFVPPFALALALAAGVSPTAQEPATPQEPAAREAQSEDAQAEAARLEKDLRETLTGATLTGRWRTVRDGALGEEKEETYSISSVTKAAGDLWIIAARIQYGDKDVTLPVPVRVRWAGDTPVIQVTDAGLPGLGTYTARVLIYRDLYTGTWFGPNVTGTLTGTIRRDEDKPEEGNREAREGDAGAGKPGNPAPQRAKRENDGSERAKV